MVLSAKVKKSLNIGFRIVIALLAFWFIYRQVVVTGDFEHFRLLFVERAGNSRFMLIVLMVLIMMPLNWGVETVKWKLLVSYVEKISFFSAFRSVMTGISTSLFTPNRVGEFFGRVFTLKLADPLKGVLLTIAGSLSQLIVTLLFGSFSLIAFLPLYFNTNQLWARYLYFGVVLFVIIGAVFMIMLFLRSPVLSASIHSMVKPGWNKIHEYIAVLQSVERKVLLKVLLLSMFRYLIFSTQFYLMLRAFDLSIPFLHAFMLISMTYFVATAIPTVALVDLGIRGSVAIYFIGMYFKQGEQVAMAILSATTTIWIVNLALPALLGLLFINRLTFIRKSTSDVK